MEILNYIGEIWKPIAGYEGYYEVSNFGRVRSVDRYVDRGKSKIFFKGKIIRPFVCHYKYLSVDLRKNGSSKTFKVHRLVAIAFIPNPNNYPEIDHIDNSPQNNSVWNLRWVNHKTNCQNPNSFIRINKIEQLDMEGNYIKTWNSPREAEDELGIWQNSIKSCCDNKPHYLSAGGFKWRYA